MKDQIRRVAVTGAAGYVGDLVIQRLERDESIERIVAIDLRPLERSPGPKTVFLQRDASEPIDQVLSEHAIDAVAHLAFILKPSHARNSVRHVNVEGTRRVLEGCVQAGVKHFVYLSSSTVYGAHPDNPRLLSEESPRRPVKGFQYGEDKVQAEEVIEEFVSRSEHLTAAVLRACPVLGPNANNYIASSFAGALLVRLRGADPPMQFLHEDDLTELVARCILNRASGVYNVAGDGTVTWREVASGSGRIVLVLPTDLLYGMTSLTWKLRLQNNAPPAGLNFIRYPWVVSTEKIKRELGFSFQYSSREAWQAFRRRERNPDALSGTRSP